MSDRELVAEKAALILSEAIKISKQLPVSEWIDVDYLGAADRLFVYHWVNKKIVSSLSADLSSENALLMLDRLLQLVETFDSEVAA